MSPSSLSSPDYEFLLSKLTPKIQANLPDWYGLDAKLSGPPKIREREWSFFIRYPIRVSKAQDRAVLVKIRRCNSEMNIARAVANDLLKEEVKNEYNLLVKIKQTLTEEGNEFFFAINPLTYYNDLNALVMEEADIRPLKTYFRSPDMWIRNKRIAFENLLEHAGKWLRVYHDQIWDVKEKGDFFSNTLYENAQENLEQIKKTYSCSNLTHAQKLLDELYRRYKGAILPHRNIHGDFNCANIFVTGDGKICSLDPKNSFGAIYIDLAKIMTDLESCINQVLTNRTTAPLGILKSLNLSVLKGYFNQQPIDNVALDLFRILSLIEKWREDENKLEQSIGKPASFYYLAAPQMRNYFSKLIGCHVQKFKQDHL
jgi:predicted transcriptional regulator